MRAEASEIDGIHLDTENHRRLAEGLAEEIRRIRAEKENSL